VTNAAKIRRDKMMKGNDVDDAPDIKQLLEGLYMLVLFIALTRRRGKTQHWKNVMNATPKTKHHPPPSRLIRGSSFLV
jgi:hypothetical protein